MQRLDHHVGARPARSQLRQLRRWLAATGVLLTGLLAAGAAPAAAAAGTVSANKTVSSTDISCDGSTTVTLTLQATTGVAGNPTDVMLVLDRSGSMQGPLL